METFVEIANSFQPLTIFAKSSIIDFLLDSKYLFVKVSGKTSGFFLKK